MQKTAFSDIRIRVTILEEDMAVLDDADAEAVDVIEEVRDDSVDEMIETVFHDLDLPLGEEISADVEDGS
jgi:predicted methyltransferase